ncbi:hypothetical protein Hanom_Chr07g00672001 [Helianthus anomalus]
MMLFVDDDTFPGSRVSVTPLRKFCLFLIGHKFLVNGLGKAALWNLTIRKTVELVVPSTNDPKIVKITHIVSWGDMESASCIHWQVGVFTLSPGAWRRLGANLPHDVIYWLATMDGGSCNLIISYNITSEVFGEVNLPNRLTHSPSRHWLSLFKLREFLVVLDNVCEHDRIAYDVWMMEDGISKSFTKSGEHIIEFVEGNRGLLFAYEPNSKNIDNLGIVGMFCSFDVHHYIETLSLLDQPPTTHNGLETQIKETDDQTMGSGF